MKGRCNAIKGDRKGNTFLFLSNLGNSVLQVITEIPSKSGKAITGEAIPLHSDITSGIGSVPKWDMLSYGRE